jgi:hypothetical protein
MGMPPTRRKFIFARVPQGSTLGPCLFDPDRNAFLPVESNATAGSMRLREQQLRHDSKF